MIEMNLHWFTQDDEFPFYVQRGEHDTAMIIHNHVNFTELTAVIDGTALHCVNDEVYFIKRGDIFVISGDTKHGYRNPNNLKIYNIMFREGKLFDADSDIYKLNKFQQLFLENQSNNGFQSRLTLTHNDFEKFDAAMKEMLREYEKKETGWRTLVKANFTEIAVMLLRMYDVSSDSLKINIINIDRAVFYMEKNYTKQISISEIASISHISERHFARIFRQMYKTTPYEYILELRMQHACMLLKKTLLSISEIALQCGFNNSNYFTRKFHMLFNVTPRKYRMQSNGEEK